MGHKIAFVSQKGGVSKSTLSRALGTTYAAAGWNVKIADLDINQSTSFTWLQRRLKSGVTPEVAVETFGTVASALKVADTYDLMIFDGAPHATKATADFHRDDLDCGLGDTKYCSGLTADIKTRLGAGPDG